MNTKTIAKTKIKLTYPLIKKEERILIWKKAKGMWKNSRPDPIKELNKMKQEWENYSSVNC